MNNQSLSVIRERLKPHNIAEILGEEYTFEVDDNSLAPVKRIALVAESFFPRYDGVAQHVYNTLCYLQQTGREVLLFAPDDAPSQVGGSKVIRVPSFTPVHYPGLRVGQPVRSISDELKRFQPDLITVFAPVFMSARAISFANKRHIPVIATYETDLPQYMAYYKATWMKGSVKRWLRHLHNGCQLTLAPSLDTLRKLHRAGFRKLVYWPKGVNEQRFNPANATSAWHDWLLHGRPASSLVCLYVGRLAREKNIESLLKVAQMPGVALTIIGDGPQRNQLKAMFSGTQTYFPGRLHGHALACACASADIFVFPSTTETFGLVTLEAMASGLPAIIRKQNAGANLVAHGKTGFVCDTSEAFVEAVQRFQSNPQLRSSMSLSARQEALHHSWNRVMPQLEGFYSQVMRQI